jgi:enoyl-CoA hydratase/carnithine racemase
METLQLETKGTVAWVWLNRPRRLNAIDETTLDELDEAFAALADDEAVRAIVLAARGPVFCAGFDVAWMAGLEAATVARQVGGVEAVYDAIEACPKPLVAAIHGAAMGGGLLLTLVADACLATEGASFGAPEVKIGIFPNLRLIPRLERIVGQRAAKRMVLSGDPVDAGAALSLGLVERVLPEEELHAATQALAEYLSGAPPAAVQTAKAAFAAARQPGFTAWEREQFAACWARPEREMMMQIFLQAGKG